mmetsp:Transcript_17326/g.29300  ORF Transcript_17326/g.29300 Transcript_17326/m.29300 type:complete len:226 (+) Transcript_17326:152-829(+)|eukprot:CAMPEP_0174967870 /NCGR_PEP_ID=MMETSP0004_2-20121128/7818_1 /TAXON_ID=420556 /ORGANISM="Ochromonas sp., Strain CCMP1393" /LENGTH=225 /DNA_ID=CAMNT_0016217039 /DNA_START=142 /DNA_END=819 /DNA_ORIENTATION=-
MSSLESELEEEIRLELEQLEKVFNDQQNGETFDDKSTPEDTLHNGRVSYSAFEFAKAEGEKEELEDKLNLLMTKTEDFSNQINQMSRINSNLLARNKQLVLDNEKLHQQLQSIEHDAAVASTSSPLSSGRMSFSDSHNGNVNNGITNSSGSKALELLLAETRHRLLVAEQAHHDACVDRDAIAEQLEQEKVVRTIVEKERDAYSAAYEASLEHFDKWRQQHQPPA